MDNKIHIKTTYYHRMIAILSILVLAGTFLYLLFAWNELPDKVPGHFNGAGVIDRWGSKYELIVIPIVSVFLFLGISLMEKYPDAWNTGVKVTEENKERVYLEIKNMIVTLKFLVTLTFAFITIFSSLTKPLPSWFLPLDLLLIFSSMVYFFMRLVLKSKQLK